MDGPLISSLYVLGQTLSPDSCVYPLFPEHFALMEHVQKLEIPGYFCPSQVNPALNPIVELLNMSCRESQLTFDELSFERRIKVLKCFVRNLKVAIVRCFMDSAYTNWDNFKALMREKERRERLWAYYANTSYRIVDGMIVLPVCRVEMHKAIQFVFGLELVSAQPSECCSLVRSGPETEEVLDLHARAVVTLMRARYDKKAVLDAVKLCMKLIDACYIQK